ncbi:hypothetical protein SAMN05518672_1147 [Chitinophaga sp. CF118]|uniref:hypothetical protein n=1 Tax=Chitinophaga sp. CF118 TaxID=1884367 RepID=UPI0008F1F760|nr:hypothetical protein [Chitinophaga sp. CF118]SFF00438.1 hypothetical protein SAMN05518672_1147 [Chitinophaga sp. CF118]
MKQLLFVLPLLFCTELFAQTPVEKKISKAKYDIIKRTVEFLSTDTASFEEVKENKCKSCIGNSYEALKQFAKDNGLKNVDLLIDGWRDKKVLPNKRALEKFDTLLLRKITTNSSDNKKRSKRITIDSYGAYRDDVRKTIDDYSNATVINGDSATPLVAQQADTAKEETKNTALVNKGSGITNDNKGAGREDDPQEIPWLYLAGGAFLAFLTLYFFIEGRKNREKINKLKKELKDVIRNRDANIDNLRVEVKSLKEKISETEERLAQVSDKQAEERKAYQQKVREAREEIPKDKFSKDAVSDRPRGFGPIVKYARYADLGDGFSSEDLLDNHDSETIFEITITAPDAGTYKVTSNQQAQKYALSNASYFLSNTCLYDSLPSVDSTIITNEPGVLLLKGNKWVIHKPARLSFN